MMEVETGTTVQQIQDEIEKSEGRKVVSIRFGLHGKEIIDKEQVIIDNDLPIHVKFRSPPKTKLNRGQSDDAWVNDFFMTRFGITRQF